MFTEKSIFKIVFSTFSMPQCNFLRNENERTLKQLLFKIVPVF